MASNASLALLLAVATDVCTDDFRPHMATSLLAQFSSPARHDAYGAKMAGVAWRWRDSARAPEEEEEEEQQQQEPAPEAKPQKGAGRGAQGRGGGAAGRGGRAAAIGSGDAVGAGGRAATAAAAHPDREPRPAPSGRRMGKKGLRC
uniref:Uncharacterized protein n=1 Tax=Pyrodinium bahamense TaxID=73915 RepID=A0A7S0A8U1_9DINO|mmetsp:Transcript_27186/g.74789  ORF Transcript_27186/g.74789 Transcript_27186/m.74789 type:complete len:146 (+) Transcript_27186:25-462(+)